MNIEDLAHPSWEAHGWTRTKLQVCLYTFGDTEPADGLAHPDAPGLALVGYDLHGRKAITFTHIGTGMNAGLLHSASECPACPAAIRDAARESCKVIDYATITLADARALPADTQERAREPFRTLAEHVCDACAWWHAADLPKRIAELEDEVEERRENVARAEDALAEAEEDLHNASAELAELKKRLKEAQR